MANFQYIDDIVKEYLLYRGFNSALKAFDNDLKYDKDKGFRVDKIVDQIVANIYSYDLTGLRELWSHMDTRMFSKLEQNFAPGVKKLENGVLKLYLVNAVMNNKSDKVVDFFAKMTPELQGQSEWKDWFVLPYTKSPEENLVFSLYFTKQWQDTLLVSLHNLLAIVFQCMPQPRIANVEEDAARMKKLQEENEVLKGRLAMLLDRAGEITACDAAPPTHLSDDFYSIAQESVSSDNQAKSLKNLIRNISTGTSPVMGRKEGQSTSKKRIATASGKLMRQ